MVGVCVPLPVPSLKVPPLAFPIVAVVLVAVAGFSVTGAVEVARGRREVERNVGWLVALQKANEHLADGPPTAETLAVFDALSVHPSAEVAEAAGQARPALATQLPSAQLAAVGRVVAALRRANAHQSERLGGYIRWLYLTVALLVVLSGATLWLLWRLRSGALAMARLAEERIASAQQDHFHKLATVHALAASTAHEVNNPLTAMALNLELLQMNGEALTEPMRSAVSANLDGVARIAEIVRRLRQIAAPSSNAQVELGAVIDSTLRLLEHRVGPRAVVVQDLSERGNVRAEYVGLGQVVSNLLVNAVEAFGDRPQAENRITIATRAVDPEWVELSVSDNGPGFDPTAFDRLMTPFVTTKVTGSGLGLFVSRRIIEGFQGRLTLVRAEHGAQVEVRLRRAAVVGN